MSNYIGILYDGNVVNIRTWKECVAFRKSIKLLLTIEDDKCHSVRKYNEVTDELEHVEDDFLIDS